MLSGFLVLADGFETVSAARNLGLVCLFFFALFFWWAKRNV